MFETALALPTSCILETDSSGWCRLTGGFCGVAVAMQLLRPSQRFD